MQLRCRLLHGRTDDGSFKTRSFGALVIHLTQTHNYPVATAERTAVYWYLDALDYGEETCGECGGPADDRVKAGMRCLRCAYGAVTAPRKE